MKKTPPSAASATPSNIPLFTKALSYLVHSALSRFITQGRFLLTVHDTTYNFGESCCSEDTNKKNNDGSEEKPTLTGHLRVVEPRGFYWKLAVMSDVGLGEAIMSGDVVPEGGWDGLVQVLELLIANRDLTQRRGARWDHDGGGFIGWTARWVNWLAGGLGRLRRYSASGSLENIRQHYDLSNELFSLFLDRSWTYSCAIWTPQEGEGKGEVELGDEEGRDELRQAQWRKLDRVMEKARLKKGMRVLEIGCGWGEFAIRAAKRFGCEVVGITLSKEQLSLARKRAREAGVEELVSFELMDYRQVGQGPVRGKFDRVVSIEMLEAIGDEFLQSFFAAIELILVEDGLAVLQVITMPESRHKSYLRSTDFIQKHIFPGCSIPTVEGLIRAASAGSRLTLEHLENNGPHYATTLREWRVRFLKSVESGLVAAAGFDDLFIRKWLYYLCYCEAGFATRTLGDVQMVLSRPNNVATLGGRPRKV